MTHGSRAVIISEEEVVLLHAMVIALLDKMPEDIPPQSLKVWNEFSTLASEIAEEWGEEDWYG